MTKVIIDDDELITYMARLSDLERAGQRIQIAVGPYTAMLLIGALQLVLRHPDMRPTTTKALRGMIAQLGLAFPDRIGQEMIRRGNRTEFDR